MMIRLLGEFQDFQGVDGWDDGGKLARGAREWD